MKRFLALLSLLAIVVSGTVSTEADAASTIQRIVDHGEFRVGMSGTQPPFCMKSKAGELIGYEVDLANLLAKAMNVKLVLVEKPFGSLLDALEADEVDAVMSGMTMTPRRNLRAAFVGPYIISGKSVLTKDATIARMQAASDIDASKMTVVALANSTSQNFVERSMPDAKLVTVAAYTEGVAMVLEDKVDLMVADYPICALSVLRYADQGLVTLTEPLTLEPIGIALRPDDALMINMVENYLGALDAIGVLAQLEDLWFNDASWLIQVP